MASYGGYSSQNGYGFYINVWETRDDETYINTNKTTIHVNAVLVNGSVRTQSSGWTYTINIGGQDYTVTGQYMNSKDSADFNQGYVIYSASREMTHAGDGSLSVNVSATLSRSYYSSYDPGYCAASGKFTGQTIPRKSSISIADNTVVAGTAKNIAVSAKVSSFKDTIRVKYNGETIQTIVTKGGGSSTSYNVSWTPTLSIYANKTATNSITVTLENETYNGDTSLGTDSINVTVSIPNNSTTKPAITGITLAEANSAVSAKASDLHIGADTFIQGMSRIQATVAATSYQAATIASGSLVFNNNPAISGYPTVTTNTVTSQGNNLVISGTVTDSRGFTSNAYTSKKYNVISYHAPTFTAAFERCASDGTSDDAGTSIKYTLTGEISTINNYNTKIWRIRYKQKTASSWSGNPINLSTSYTPNVTTAVVISGLTCDADKSYVIRLEAIDIFNPDSAPVYRDYEIGVGADILNINASGKSIGIGQLSTAGANERKCEIGTDSTHIKNNLYIHDVKVLWYE